jgi:DNA-binding MarR family transcriptional regulator
VLWAKPPDPQAELQLMIYVELLFFAYRDFTSDPDQVLAELDFGRAHHRVLHFVDRYPGLRVADLLDILKITKQSLARVLKQLVDGGFIEQRTGPSDRRERLLHTTPEGATLAERLAAPQLARIAEALAAAGPGAPDLAKSFLYHMITERDRAAVDRLMAEGGGRDAEARGDDDERSAARPGRAGAR